MKKGSKIAIGLAVLVLVALVSGLTTMAVSNYGSQDDPLVTASYLNETVTPAIKEWLQEYLDQRLDAMAKELGISGDVTVDPSEGSAEPSGFVVLTLNAGETVVCGVGTEIMPRIGSVESAGPDYPRLIDEAGSVTVGDEGVALTTNHMYMVTIKGNGVRALEDLTKILIRGEYTVEPRS